MSLIWSPRENPAPRNGGRVLPFITRWRAPLELSQPERIELRSKARPRPAAAKEPIPITVKVRVRY